MTGPRETDLYPPVKAFLQSQGYEVKAEVQGVDVLACRGDDPPLIVELKLRFSLALLQQAMARLALSDTVYLAVPAPKGRAAVKAMRANAALCRRLGLGLLLVSESGAVEPRLDPGAWRPRIARARQGRLLREFARREGDPNRGGMTRATIVTAYRQDAVRLARHLALHGACKGAVVAAATGVGRATRIMADDHYGWFERLRPGVYCLTPKGLAALEAATGA